MKYFEPNKIERYSTNMDCKDILDWQSSILIVTHPSYAETFHLSFGTRIGKTQVISFLILQKYKSNLVLSVS